jgi:RNA-binding protein
MGASGFLSGAGRQFITLSGRAEVWHFLSMPAPTSPRKKSLMPSTLLRRRLRGLGHTLDPVVQIGKQGAIESVVKQITRALLDHELIKLKLGAECPQTRFELAEQLGAEPGVKVVQILGRTILLYKRNPKKPKFEKAAEGKPAATIRHKP